LKLLEGRGEGGSSRFFANFFDGVVKQSKG
jgi:hypothetical protein